MIYGNINVIKRKICIVLLLLNFFSVLFMTYVSANEASSFNPFAGDRDIRIAYLGGSITEGAGSTDPNTKCWVAKIGAYFRDKYSSDSVKVSNFNKGIGGTGSELGSGRIYRDIISNNPDMVFVEYAVNDKWLDEARATQYMENIVLTLQQMEKIPYVIFVYTPEANSDRTGIDERSAAAYHQMVADFYGIPSIDLRKIIKEDTSVNISDLLGDGTHPNDTGYEYYYNVIKRYLDTEPEKYFVRPQMKKNRVNTNSKPVYGKYTKINNNTNLDDGTLTINFAGNVFILLDYFGDSYGKYEIKIDGKDAILKDRYYAGIKRQYGMAYCNYDLDDGVHTAIITKKTQNENSSGDNIELKEYITMDNSKIIQGVTLSDIEGNLLNSVNKNSMNFVNISLKNVNNSEIVVVGIVALYDSENTLRGISYINKSVDKYSSSEYGIGIMTPDEEGLYFKTYLWDNFRNLKPLDNCYIRYSVN